TDKSRRTGTMSFSGRRERERRLPGSGEPSPDAHECESASHASPDMNPNLRLTLTSCNGSTDQSGLENLTAHLDDEDDLTPEIQQAFRIFQSFLSEKHKCITAPFWCPMGPGDHAEMCFRKMDDKFVNHEYESITAFVSDFRLMLENCYRFHGVDHWISKQAQKLEIILEQKLTLLSRSLREKTTLAVTSGGRFGTEDEKAALGSSSRRRSVPRSIMGGGSESIMVQALRLEELQRAKDEKRQREQERKEAEEASVKELEDWESSLLSLAEPCSLWSLWELPAIGHFLCLAQTALHLPEIVFYELERCLLMPRCSVFLAKVMTALLCPPQKRSGVPRRPQLLYRRWESELRRRVQSWYRAVGRTEEAARAERLGLCPQFFWTLGAVSPLEETPFHLLPFQQRVWLLKGLCDHVYETQKEVQDAVLAQPIHECRESILGYDQQDNTYIHFPHFCGADLRIYSQSPCGAAELPLPLIHIQRSQEPEEAELRDQTCGSCYHYNYLFTVYCVSPALNSHRSPRNDANHLSAEERSPCPDCSRASQESPRFWTRNTRLRRDESGPTRAQKKKRKKKKERKVGVKKTKTSKLSLKNRTCLKPDHSKMIILSSFTHPHGRWPHKRAAVKELHITLIRLLNELSKHEPPWFDRPDVVMYSSESGPFTRSSKRHQTGAISEELSPCKRGKMDPESSLTSDFNVEVASREASQASVLPEPLSSFQGTCKPIQALLAKSVGNKVTLISHPKAAMMAQVLRDHNKTASTITTTSATESNGQVVYKTAGGVGLLRQGSTSVNFSVQSMSNQKSGAKAMQQVVILPSNLLIQSTGNKAAQTSVSIPKTTTYMSNVSGFTIPENKVPVQPVAPLKDTSTVRTPSALVTPSLRNITTVGVPKKTTEPKVALNKSASSGLTKSDAKQELRTVCIRDSQSILVTTRGGNTGVVKVQKSESGTGALPPSPVFNISPQLHAFLVSKSSTSNTQAVSATIAAKSLPGVTPPSTFVAGTVTPLTLNQISNNGTTGKTTIPGKSAAQTSVSIPKTTTYMSNVSGFTIPENKVPVQPVAPLKDTSTVRTPSALVTPSLRNITTVGVPKKTTEPKVALNKSASSGVTKSDAKQELRTVCIRDSQSILVTTRGGNTGVVKVQKSESGTGALPPSPVFNISPQLHAFLVSKSSTSNTQAVSATIAAKSLPGVTPPSTFVAGTVTPLTLNQISNNGTTGKTTIPGKSALLATSKGSD
uniref:Bromo domain-containing protein n=1 Tax=Sinocyclocheilus anshuiensis TaxID=1608454 RepID=A0A671RW77_9TELE